MNWTEFAVNTVTLLSVVGVRRTIRRHHKETRSYVNKALAQDRQIRQEASND